MSGDYSRFTGWPWRRYTGVLMQQGRVQLDGDWNEHVEIGKRRWEVQAEDTFGPYAVPRTTTPDGFRVARVSGDLTLGDGRIYVHGKLAEIFRNEKVGGQDVSYRNQPFYPAPPSLPAGGFIVYLDVWDREVTYIEDPDLLEKALGGPDTATRIQTVWQVKVHEVRAPQSPACGTDLDALFPPSGGRLGSRAVAPPASDDPCVLPPTGGFRGLENRLYRVEVHTGGTSLSGARIKWSRENASVVSAVTGMESSGSESTLTVSRIGRDAVLRFQIDDWVEVTDDHRELMGEAGEMARVKRIDETGRKLILDRVVPAAGTRAFGADDQELRARHTRVRRWDHGRNAGADGLVTPTTGWMPLEDGIEIRLSIEAGKRLHVGDYWVLAARTVDGSVEELVAAAPRGIHHDYAQLAAWTGRDLHDCRRLWPGDCCCCTVEVGDGVRSHGDYDNIETALKETARRVHPQTRIQICLLPGDHRPPRTVVIDRNGVTISGCGRRTRVICPDSGTIFDVRGHSVRLERLYLSWGDPQSGPLVRLSGCRDAEVEENLFENLYGSMLHCDGAASPRILGNRFQGREGILVQGSEDVLIAGNEIRGQSSIEQIPERGLIDLRAGTMSVRVLENRLDAGPGHGITLSPTLQNGTAGSLYEVVIAGNEISTMRGSGIATSFFNGVSEVVSPVFPTGTASVYIYRLQIEHNMIVGCASPGTWKRSDGAPQGSIVVGGVERLQITDNQLRTDDGGYFTPPVAGIYIGHSRGLIVRDNVIINVNSVQSRQRPVEQIEGGIVALDLAVAIEKYAVEMQGFVLLDFRPDGWPAAMVHGNLVVAPRGRALTLRGVGPMQVTDNRLISRELVSVRGTVSFGAVLIATSRSSLRTWQTATVGASSHGREVHSWREARWTDGSVPAITLPIGDGDVAFSDNHVVLDQVASGEHWFGIVVVIAASDDLAFHDNLVRCQEGAENLRFNTYLHGTTTRATGNGIFESQRSSSSVTLYLSRLGLCTVTDNQTTHCIKIEPPGTVQVVAEDNNLHAFCNPGIAQPVGPDVVLTHVEADQVAMLARFRKATQSEVETLKEQRATPTARAGDPHVQAVEARIQSAERLRESLEAGLRTADRMKEIQPGDWTLMGRVLDSGGKPIAGARLELVEGDRRLTEIPADEQGEIFAHYSESRFKDIFQRAPQLKVTVRAADGTVLQVLEKTLTPVANRVETFEIRLGEAPGPQPGKTGGPRRQPAPGPAAATEEPAEKKEAAPSAPQPDAEPEVEVAPEEPPKSDSPEEPDPGKVKRKPVPAKRKRTPRPRKKDR